MTMLWTDFNNNGFLDPWKEFERMERMISRFMRGGDSYDFPAANMWIAPDNSVVTTEVPGIEPNNIDISVSGKTVTLRGARKTDELKEGGAYHRRERRHGQFSRTVELPFNIEADKVHARFSKGILSIVLPRAEAEKPRKIEIKSE